MTTTAGGRLNEGRGKCGQQSALFVAEDRLSIHTQDGQRKIPQAQKDPFETASALALTLALALTHTHKKLLLSSSNFAVSQCTTDRRHVVL